MVLTNEEITGILGYIENQIHNVNKIDFALSEIQNSTIIELKTGFDSDLQKKEHLKNIVKMIRFGLDEQGITQIPSAFTRTSPEVIEALAI